MFHGWVFVWARSHHIGSAWIIAAAAVAAVAAATSIAGHAAAAAVAELRMNRTYGPVTAASNSSQ
jgi:hypothetical protein